MADLFFARGRYKIRLAIETVVKREMLGFREKEILTNAIKIERNFEVPSEYFCIRIFDKNENFFEITKKENGEISITN